MAGRTFAEKVLSAKSGRNVRAGDFVVCYPDLVLGTDGSTPMAIDRFEEMGGNTVANPDLLILSRDHYAPPTSNATYTHHARMEDFAATHGIELLEVGDGIGFQVALENGRVHPGDLVIGADSHTVSCGAVGAFATGVGSTDLAAAFLTGKVWLRVPATKRVVLDGMLPHGVGAKDVALDVVRRFGPDGADYLALEFAGTAVEALEMDSRMVISNMCVETGAKTAVFSTTDWRSDDDAAYADEMHVECSNLEPLVAHPHEPANGVPVSSMAETAIDWVMLGTCSGGFAEDFRDSARILETHGGIAKGVTVVVTPPSRAIRAALEADGTLSRLRSLGAIVTETGCGPCCGTSAPIPPPNVRILSTANRNFQGRMGEASALIYLASPITCAAAAARGHVVDPRELV